MTVRKSLCQRHTTCQFLRFLFGFQQGPHYTVMLQAYLDESGHPDDPNSDVFSVAAVVSTEEGWHAFEDRWDAVMKSHGLQGLHMSEYVSGNGEFSYWKDKGPEAIEFIDSLGSILIETVQYGCVVSVAMEDWNEVMRDRFETHYERKRAALIVLFQGCLEKINETLLLPTSEKIACLFEENPALGGGLPGHFANWKKAWGLEKRFGSFGFGEKYEHRGLEGADMLAYEGMKYYKNVRKGKAERKLHRRLKASGIDFSIADQQTFYSYLMRYSEHFDSAL